MISHGMNIVSLCIRVWLGCILFLTVNLSAQPPATDFPVAKGSYFYHKIENQDDLLSAREIIELRSDEGLPVWFGRDFRKVVCLTGQCRMVNLWLFWDGAGNYLRFQENPGDLLTKTDHTVFTAADYKKLHRILSDTVSVLKDLKQEELIIKPVKTKGSVDAVSSATQPFLQEYLVKNAAYTCFTLWHTAYGETRKEILRILDKRANEKYLKLIFEKNDPTYLRWSVDFIRRHPVYHAIFYKQIMVLIKNKDEILSKRSLDYFSKDRLADKNLQKELIRSFKDFSYQRKSELLWKLSEVQKIDDEVILYLLDLFEKEQMNATLLGYTYRLIRKDNLQNSKIRTKQKKLLAHKNLYVRNITHKLLTEVSVGN